jgi:thiol:disulfide interchange protein DsbA
MKKTLILILSLSSFFTFAQSGFEVIKENKIINDKKTLVQEFFFYGCQHCKRLEKPLNIWLKTVDYDKVKFEKVPVDFGAVSMVAAKHFYTAKLLGVEKEFTPIYFKSLVLDRKKASDELAIKILIGLGEKESSIKSVLESNSVKISLKRVTELTDEMRAYTVPTLVVNGKYKVNAKTAGGEKNIFNIVNSLID